MKLLFLGSGSAFTVGADNYQSNMILEGRSKKRLLIDCGTDIRFSMYEQGLDYNDIHALYISHLHADHVGGLEWLAFKTYFDPDCTKPVLYTAKSIIGPLWKNVLSGSLSSAPDSRLSLNTFFKVKGIGENGSFKWDNKIFQLIKTEHTMKGKRVNPSFGLLFSDCGLKIFITTDTQLSKNYMSIFKQADIIFHDCEIIPKPSGIHANYKELRNLSSEIKSKIWLYHYNPGKLPNAKKDGFRGFVKKGQVFDFADQSTL